MPATATTKSSSDKKRKLDSTEKPAKQSGSASAEATSKQRKKHTKEHPQKPQRAMPFTANDASDNEEDDGTLAKALVQSGTAKKKQKLSAETPSAPAQQKQTKAAAAATSNQEKVLHPLQDYLKSWKENHESWKKKVSLETKIFRQFDVVTLFTPKYFKLFLQYVDTIRGNARKRLFDLAVNKLEEQKDIVRKELLSEIEIRQGVSKKQAESLVTDAMIQERLNDNVKARRCNAVLEVLVLTDLKNGIDLNDETRQPRTIQELEKQRSAEGGDDTSDEEDGNRGTAEAASDDMDEEDDE